VLALNSSTMKIRRIIFGILIVLVWVSVSHAGAVNANMDEAISAYNAENYLTARRLFKEIALQGDPVAQRYLGIMYDKGQGGLKNYEKAVEWYKKAANQNDAKAQYLLGAKYANGYGVRVDEKLAYAWFAISFQNGYEPAAAPLKVLNQTLSMSDRQVALQLATKKLTQLP
jgi:TPR repeat protein